MELLVHFVYSQIMYLNDLNRDAKFYLHSFNSFKMMVQNRVKFVPRVSRKKCDIFTKTPYLLFSVIKRTVFIYMVIISFKVILLGL